MQGIFAGRENGRPDHWLYVGGTKAGPAVRRMACILKVERRTDTSRESASSCSARTGSREAFKFVTECRQSPLRSGAAKQFYMTVFQRAEMEQPGGSAPGCPTLG